MCIFLKNSEQNLLCDLINLKTTFASFQSSNKLFKVYFEIHIVIFHVLVLFTLMLHCISEKNIDFFKHFSRFQL